jgi:hypothetical protein
MSKDSIAYNLEEIINKEARALKDDNYIGRVEGIGENHIVIKKGTRNGRGPPRFKRYDIPKNLLDHFDSNIVYFNITLDEAKQYFRE